MKFSWDYISGSKSWPAALLPLLALALTSCSGLFYYPTKIKYSRPGDYKLKYHDVFITTKDNHRLHGQYFKNLNDKSKSKSLILFFHGNAENLSSHYYNLAWITKHDHEYIIFDYRGYGKSPGVPDQLGTYYDAMAALDFAWKEFKKGNHQKFIVYGQSLGGIIASRALLDFPHKDKIDLLIMDSTFLSYRDLAFDKASSNWLTFLFSPLTLITISDKMSPKDQIGKLKISALIIHGTADGVIPFKFGEEVYRLWSGPKWFWKIPNGRHTDIFFGVAGKKYRKKFLSFIYPCRSEF